MTKFAYEVVHKKQTKLNDCWYACIQMIRTFRASNVKTKPMGGSVKRHREAGKLKGGFWGQSLGAGDEEFNKIVSENKLKHLRGLDLTSLDSIQETLNLHGPFMVGGDFGKIGRLRGTSKWMMEGFGHYIVVAGTDSDAKAIFIHDPWRSHGTKMTMAEFEKGAWDDVSRVVLANAALTPDT